VSSSGLYTSEQRNAAERIQAVQRGKVGRRRVEGIRAVKMHRDGPADYGREQEAAAVRIQAVQRGKMGRHYADSKYEAQQRAAFEHQQLLARRAAAQNSQAVPPPSPATPHDLPMYLPQGRVDHSWPASPETDYFRASSAPPLTGELGSPLMMAPDWAWSESRPGRHSALEPIELMNKTWEEMRYEEVTRVLHEMGVGQKRRGKRFTRGKRRSPGDVPSWDVHGQVNGEREAWMPIGPEDEIPSREEMQTPGTKLDKIYRNESREALRSSQSAGSIGSPAGSAIGAVRQLRTPKKTLRPTPLPRVSHQAINPAPLIVVRGYNDKAARIVVPDKISWNEFLDSVTDVLDERSAVTKLYDEHDNEINSAAEVAKHQTVFIAKQVDLDAYSARVGRQRALSPVRLMQPLLNQESYAKLTHGADKRAKRPNPPKIIVRANHWSQCEPPSQYAAQVLVTGTYAQLLDEVTRRLAIPISVQNLFHTDDRLVTGVEDIQTEETLYTMRSNLVSSGRDWGKTLCPQKRKIVTVHANHWSDAPPPSRYQQKVLVEEHLGLLYMKTTEKLKTNGPVIRLFHKNGEIVKSVAEIEDESHLYLAQPPDKLKLSTREWGKTLCPNKTRTICVHANRDANDNGYCMPIVAKSKDEKTQMSIVLEEITKHLSLGMMLRRMYNVEGVMVKTMDDWVDGQHYYTHPPPVNIPPSD